jgi:hypothetical protein
VGKESPRSKTRKYKKIRHHVVVKTDLSRGFDFTPNTTDLLLLFSHGLWVLVGNYAFVDTQNVQPATK